MKKIITILAALFSLGITNLLAANNPYNLKEFFPIGPAWGWERTRAYAKSAGMELWDFVDNQFKLLREHGCNTVWFVNIAGGEDFHKLLKVAEKNNIKVLSSSSILNTFYHGINDLESIDNSARQHIMTFGNYPFMKSVGYSFFITVASVVLILLFLIVARCIWVGTRSQDFLRRLVCFGVAAAILYASVMFLNKKLTPIPAYDKTVLQLGSGTLVLFLYILLAVLLLPLGVTLLLGGLGKLMPYVGVTAVI